jgi:hypothetical protein
MPPTSHRSDMSHHAGTSPVPRSPPVSERPGWRSRSGPCASRNRRLECSGRAGPVQQRQVRCMARRVTRTTAAQDPGRPSAAVPRVATGDEPQSAGGSKPARPRLRPVREPHCGLRRRAGARIAARSTRITATRPGRAARSNRSGSAAGSVVRGRSRCRCASGVPVVRG